jgi:hypothetical protein
MICRIHNINHIKQRLYFNLIKCNHVWFTQSTSIGVCQMFVTAAFIVMYVNCFNIISYHLQS